MANQLYPAGIEAFTGTDKSWLLSTCRFVAVAPAYTFSVAHSTLNDIPVLQRVATSPPFAGKTNTGGVHDLANTALSGVNNPFNALVAYIDTNMAATSTLLGYFDTILDPDDGVTEIPIVNDPINADVDITINPAGLFSLLAA